MARFGARLPFLLKVLAIARPLSIQLHPDAAQARAGRAAGKASYADDRHKPELIVALEPLSALRGLKAPAEIVRGFEEHGLNDLLDAPLSRLRRAGEAGLGDFVAAVLGLEGPVAKMALEQAASALDPTLPEEAWIDRLLEGCPGDVGALAPLWMNLVEIAPGEALYQAPGVLHAYLGGAGVELMADSDNVVRAALTSKSRDLEELLDLLDARSGDPGPWQPERHAEGDLGWRTPADEFALTRRSVVPGRDRILAPAGAIEVHLCTRGRATLRQGSAEIVLEGAGAAVRSAASGELSVSGDADLWTATVP